MIAEKIAVTADIDNGLDSPVSGHFGHCRVFIITTVNDGEIVKVESIQNGSHTSCADPVNRLVDIGVTTLITMGMGMRPFMAAQQVGLTVIRGEDGTVGDAVRSYISGQAHMMDNKGLCSGGGSHRH